MVKDYIRTIYSFFRQEIRRVVNQPLFSGIKLLGLTIGISCVIIISLWVQNEISYDKFHEKPENIYRVIMNMGENGNLVQSPPGLIYKMKNDFPEVELAVRMVRCPELIVKSKDHNYNEKGGIYADPDFFNIFSFDLLQGDKSSLLSGSYNIVITEALAVKYFGNDDVVNKTLTMYGHSFQITGVLKNLPGNSHLQFDFVLPMQLKTQLGSDLKEWGDVYLYTYIKVKEHTDFNILNNKVKKWKTPREETFYLQSLLDIHSESGFLANNTIITDKKYVFIFASVALLILLIACVNYISLFLSSTLSRSKEIAIQKILGSGRKRLILKFMSESVNYIVIALFLSFVLVRLFLPKFNQIIGSQLSFSLGNTSVLTGACMLGCVLLLIIGVYPALHLSSIKPLSTLKNNKGGLGFIGRFKNVMVLLQFLITTVLIVCVLQVSKQMNYIQNKELGFTTENIVCIPYSGIVGHYPAFKQKLLENSSVINLSVKNSLPVEVADKTDEISWPGKNVETNFLIEATGVGFDYFETMGVNIVEGRSFSSEIPSDKGGVIMNQKAIKMLNLSDPVGKTINFWGDVVKIIGVTHDALFYSLKEEVAPQIYYMLENDSEEAKVYGVMLAKISDTNIEETLESIKSVWNEFAPEGPFSYHFLDEVIEGKYWAEKRMLDIMKYFVFLSIFLSCLGLFGAARFSTQNRTKEIGVRKVNGAKTGEIIRMLNKSFIKWVVVAFVIASPIAYYVLNKWLQNFAYKAELSWWIFALAGIMTIMIALLTVSWITFRAARRNPVEALRYE